MFIKNFEKISKQFSVSINDYECFFDLPTILSELMCSAPPENQSYLMFSGGVQANSNGFTSIHLTHWQPPPLFSAGRRGLNLLPNSKFQKGGGGLERAAVFRGGWLYSARRGCKLSTKNKLKLEYFMIKKVYKQELFVLS